MRKPQSVDKPSRRYILLDRDGVINRRIDGGYVTSWPQFEFMPRALNALKLLNENKFTTLVVSNQAAVAKGLMTSEELDFITRKFLAEVALAGGEIAQVYYCRHSTEDRCTCRKPSPGLIVRARMEHGFSPAQTYLVGDSPNDLIAATAAGCPGILIRQQDSSIPSPHLAEEDFQLTAFDLYEAVEEILSMNAQQEPEHEVILNYRSRL